MSVGYGAYVDVRGRIDPDYHRLMQFRKESSPEGEDTKSMRETAEWQANADSTRAK